MHRQTTHPITRYNIAYLMVLFIALGTQPVRSQMPKQINNKLSLPAKAYDLKFKWQGDSVNNGYEKHSAILIPVKLIGCPKTFYMQFDLGSPYSLLYRRKIETIKVRYPSTKTTIITPTTASTGLNLGKKKINAESIVLRDFGSAAIDLEANEPQIIGTLGVDIFDGKILVIDYPRQRITIAPEVTDQYQIANYSPFTYIQRSILLPAYLQGKKTILFFDTGSSRYALLSDEKTVKALAKANQQPIISKVSSWGKILIANTFSTDASITIAGENLPLQQVTFMQGASNTQIEMMMKMGIGGMTGNKLLLNFKLVLDTRKKQFALIR